MSGWSGRFYAVFQSEKEKQFQFLRIIKTRWGPQIKFKPANPQTRKCQPFCSPHYAGNLFSVSKFIMDKSHGQISRTNLMDKSHGQISWTNLMDKSHGQINLLTLKLGDNNIVSVQKRYKSRSNSQPINKYQAKLLQTPRSSS